MLEYAQNMITYVDHSTNDYNFEKNKEVKKIAIKCDACKFEADELKHFAGKTVRHGEAKYFCRKKNCIQAGFPDGYPYADDAFAVSNYLR